MDDGDETNWDRDLPDRLVPHFDGQGIERLRDIVPTFDFCVIDFETTGLNPDYGAEIIEIGAVRIENGRRTDTFQQLVEPLRPIPRNITEITGITNGMVAGKPPIDDVLPKLVEFMGDAILIAHNFSFDFSFLDQYHPGSFFNHFICTVKMARNVASFRSNSLDHLVEALDLERSDAHRAFDDAFATGGLFLHLTEQVSAPEDYRKADVPGCLRQLDPGALALYLPGIGPKKARNIGSYVSGTRDLLTATRSEYEAIDGVGPALAGTLENFSRQFDPIPPVRNQPLKIDGNRSGRGRSPHRDRIPSVDELVRQV